MHVRNVFTVLEIVSRDREFEAIRSLSVERTPSESLSRDHIGGGSRLPLPRSLRPRVTMAHPPCGTAQILLKRGCAATSLCCAPSAGDSQVARSRHHHTHRLGGGMMVPPLSPPWGQPWPGQAVPFRRSSGRHGAAPLPPPLLRGTPGERIIRLFMMRSRGEWPPRMPTPFTIPARTPAHESRSRHGRASCGDSRRRSFLACARCACSRPVGRACMAPCHRIRMIRGGILAYSASYARGCAYLGAVVA